MGAMHDGVKHGISDGGVAVNVGLPPISSRRWLCQGHGSL